jgi:LysM repeat protein
VSRQRRSLSRRRFLAATAAIPLAVAIGPHTALARGSNSVHGLTPALPARPPVAIGPGDPKHLAWVWQFRHDGDRAQIRDVLAAHGLGIAMKTHDSVDWMSKYDDSPEAIDGPDAVASLVRYFEDGGVPFHSWSVLHGEDPVAEATLASQVLSAGARSVIVDLEAHSGFWRGTTDDAERYGAELRRLQPSAFVATSIDARPWEVPRIPMAEFAQFTNAIAPQVYWGAFNNSGNIAKYRSSGDDPGEAGITPRFALQSALRAVSEFGLPVHPIGDGTVGGGDEWSDFIDEAFASRAEALSVWRFGVADDAVWQLLRDSPPRTLTYAVQSGDTLSGLAVEWGTTVDAIVETNGIANPNFLFIGQELRIPGGGGSPAGGTSPAAPAPVALPTQRYTVQPGDSLWSISRAFGTTVDDLALANGISDQGYIRIGDTLILP